MDTEIARWLQIPLLSQMGAIYDAESPVVNATKGFQAGLRAPQTSWLSASSSLLTIERNGGPHHCAGTEGDLLATGNGDFLITRS